MNDLLSYRMLCEKDWPDFKALRLESLIDSPAAFGGSYEEESIKEDSFFINNIKNNSVFGAYMGDNLVGIVGLSQSSLSKYKHRGKIFGVYTTASARGRGICKVLIRQVVDHAKTLNMVWIELQVWTKNPSAIKMYTSMNFIIYGTEFRSLMYGENEYADYYCMCLNID